MPIIRRADKGTPLDHAELDGNFTQLQQDIQTAVETLQSQIDSKQADLGLADGDALSEWARGAVTSEPFTNLPGTNVSNFSMANRKDVSSNTTFSLVDPFMTTFGQKWGLFLHNTAEDAVTISFNNEVPYYSLALQQLRQSFTLQPNERVSLEFQFDGQYVHMRGDPVPAATGGGAGTVVVPASSNITLDSLQHKVYEPLLINGPTIINVSGDTTGATAEITLVPDGVNGVTVQGATAWDNDAGYLNTANVDNMLSLWHNGRARYYALSRPAVAAAPAEPLQVPGAVTALSAGTPTDTTIPLTWNLPSSGGGSITDYIVQYALAGTNFASPTTVADGTSTSLSATVTGLAEVTTYDVRVAAVNPAGTGPYSVLTNLTTVATEPGGGVTAGTPVTFSSTQYLTPLGNEIYEATSQGTSYGARGVAAGTAAGDCFIEVQFPAATSTSTIFGLDAGSAVQRPHDQVDYCCQLGSTGTVTQASNSLTFSAALTTLAAGVATRVGMRRVGTVVTIETTTDDWVTKTVRHTFAAPSTGPLAAHFYTVYSTTARRICQPRVTGFA